MSDKALIERLDAIEAGSDFTDPETYQRLLYGDGAASEPTPPTQPEGETAAAPAPEPAPALAESSAPPAAAEPTVTEPVAAGVATRDGKHVIPYSVLEETRIRAQQAEARAAAANAEIERLKAQGASPQQQAAAVESIFSQDEIDAIAEDMPAAASALQKLHDAYTQLASKVAAEEASKADATKTQQALTEEEQRDVARAQAEEAMRGTPLLRQWRDAGGGLWQEAIEAEAEYGKTAEGAAKSLAERAAHVQQQIASKYGIPIPSAAPAPNPAPQPVKAAAPPAQPKPAAEVLPTLTDFNGGPMAVGDPMTGLSNGQMVDKAMGMSMEQLRAMVGLSY